ncbi:MAG TPA: hypothetical protein VGQ83_04180, partial [Polyangia bacterium]
MRRLLLVLALALPGACSGTIGARDARVGGGDAATPAPDVGPAAEAGAGPDAAAEPDAAPDAAP